MKETSTTWSVRWPEVNFCFLNGEMNSSTISISANATKTHRIRRVHWSHKIGRRTRYRKDELQFMCLGKLWQEEEFCQPWLLVVHVCHIKHFTTISLTPLPSFGRPLSSIHPTQVTIRGPLKNGNRIVWLMHFGGTQCKQEIWEDVIKWLYIKRRTATDYQTVNNKWT